MMSEQEKRDMQFQIECLTQEVLIMLMEDSGLTLEQAMDLLYNSQTYEKLERAATGLYYQGAVYVMDMLKDELNGSLCGSAV